jgi:large subunit ribosomal protein L10
MEREPRADKVAVVDDVRQRFDEADAVMVAEYRGLDVGQMAELRSALRGAGTTFKIYKNTLVRLAVADTASEGLEELLVGPTALAFVDSDASAAAKALKEFASANEALVIKGALLSGDILDAAQVRELAELPSRDELLSQLAGGLAAPLQQMASMMNNLLGEVSGLIQALSDEGGAPGAPADAPAEAPAEDAPAEAASDDAPEEAADEAAPAEEAAADEAPAPEAAAESGDED